MEFKEQLPVWKAEGVEPPETKQNEGWKVGDKPPADWFNYMWSRTYYSLDEVREKVKQEVDNLKQSGVESNEILVDNLNSKGVIASTNDTIKVNVNKVNNIKLGSGNAKRTDVLQGKTYSSDEGTELVGTMPNQGSLSKTITTQGGIQKITPGYYSSGEVKAQFANLSPNNIRAGVNIGGVNGRYSMPMFPTLPNVIKLDVPDFTTKSTDNIQKLEHTYSLSSKPASIVVVFYSKINISDGFRRVDYHIYGTWANKVSINGLIRDMPIDYNSYDDIMLPYTFRFGNTDKDEPVTDYQFTNLLPRIYINPKTDDLEFRYTGRIDNADKRTSNIHKNLDIIIYHD